MSQYPPLTPQEKRMMQELYNSGLTGYEIAIRIDRSKSVVYKYLPHVWEKPRWSEEELQEVVDGYAKGRQLNRIAKKVGRTPTAVKVAMCRYRKTVSADPKKQEVVRYLTRVLKLGIKPGRAITAIRRANIIGRYDDVL